MKRIFAAATLSLLAISAQAQVGADADSTSRADAGATARTGDIILGGEQRRHTKVDTTASVYIPPAVMGGANNCGQSNTFGGSLTGISAGAAIASESKPCNAREDTVVAVRMGFEDVARMRFFCFGADENRMAWEATGRNCPATATAKGLEAQADRRASTRTSSLYSGS